MSHGGRKKQRKPFYFSREPIFRCSFAATIDGLGDDELIEPIVHTGRVDRENVNQPD